MTDPIQGANPQGQTADTHQDIFGGSHDIFNNPDMFQPEIPKSTPKDDFVIDFDKLEANQPRSTAGQAPAEPTAQAPIEPEIIEPAAPQPQPQFIPEPEIIEQVIEPQMKPQAKVSPWKQPAQAPRPQAKPSVVEPQMKAQVKVNPRKEAISKPKPVQPIQIPKPQAKPEAPVPRAQVQSQVKPQVPVTPKPQPVQVVRPPIQTQPKPQTPVAPKAPPVEEIEVAPQVNPSDLQKKLNELITAARSIYALEKKDTDQALELLGAKNDKVAILYQITLPENGILIKKIETDISTGEEMVNDLGFVLNVDTNFFQVILDDVLLFDEVEHLQEDPKKKMQVTEKLNKFIFLLSEHQKKLEKEIKEKEEAEQERRRLQDIFRNF